MRGCGRLSLAAAILACAGALAQEVRPPDRLGEIEVGATPVVEGTDVSRYGDSVVTVGADQIADGNASDLATALSKVPGVTFSRHNVVGAYGGGDGGAIFIRGHGSGRPGADIGTLVDGVPKFSGIWTHPLLDMLPIDAAESIEVFKSAQPVLLGGMSFGAVNMVPKRRTEEGSEGRAMFAVGSWSTWAGVFEQGAKTGPFDWYIVGSHRDSEGHRANAGGVVDYLYARAGYDLGRTWHVSLQAHHSSGNVEDPEAESAAAFFKPERFITDNDMAILTFENKSERTKGHIKLYYDDGLQNWEQWADGGTTSTSDDTPGVLTDDVPYASVTNYSNYGLRARQSWEPWKGGELVVGFDWDVYGGRFVEDWPTGPKTDKDLHMTNVAPYLMLSHEFGETWKFTPSVGARWNDNDQYGSELGWQAGLKLANEKTTLHAHYAHSFNLAGVYAAVSFGGASFDTLEPELIDHMEIGWEQKLSERSKLNVVFYRDEVKNGIKMVSLVPPPPPDAFANVGDYTMEGLEISYEARLSKKLDIYIGATFTENDPADLPYSPEDSLVAGIVWRMDERWRLNATLNHFSEQYAGNPRSPATPVRLEDYTTLNLRLGCRFTETGSPTKGEVFIACDNVTNTEYELKPGYPMPGATFTFGLEVRF
jgi:outer membrane cobalamin receptor